MNFDEFKNIQSVIEGGYKNKKFKHSKKYKHKSKHKSKSKSKYKNKSKSSPNKTKVKNAAGMVLYYDKNTNTTYGLFVRDKWSKQWMVPGGGIEQKDYKSNTPVFSAFKREFWEEVGFVLPKLDNMSYIDMKKYKTRVYVGYLRKSAHPKKLSKLYKKTNETDAIKFIDLTNLKDSLKGNRYDIKYAVLDSIKAMFQKGLLVDA